MLENENTGDATGVGDDNQQTTEAQSADSADKRLEKDNTESTDKGADPRAESEQAATESTRTDSTRSERPRRRAASRPAGPPPEIPESPVPASVDVGPSSPSPGALSIPAATFQPPPSVVFQAPEVASTRRADDDWSGSKRDTADQAADDGEPEADDEADDEGGADRPSRRRRRRGGRGRGKSKDAEAAESGEPEAGESESGEAADSGAETARQPESGRRKDGDKRKARDKDSDRGKGADRGKGDDKDEAAPTAAADDSAEHDADDESDDGQSAGTRRRRRRRRRGGGDGEDPLATDDPPNTVVHVREPRAVEDEVQSVKGSTRLEAKKQRRREGREQGRRRPPIITESEFLARRESVERLMVVRRQGERTQIAVLEDGVLVEHYVDRASHQSYVGNVYLGKVQNVLPSMEAAFVDIGKGRNAVLYAGEVNWDTAGLEGQPRRIESALKSGQSVLVQVTKDPLGHKGARLTSQISLPGRYLVYVPDGSMTGISRKLPDKERNRLKQILKKVMPENAGVIVRTAAEGATEEELSRDVSRLSAQWENIQRQAKSASAPALLYGEPDLTIRVVRDVFNEDFTKLVVSGDEGWETVAEYIQYVAPHLSDRTTKWTSKQDVFDAYRIDEQIAKALDRKVWLPSGGSLVIDRTEAMTVIDVNTGKFTGQGGNLEETVTRNNLEAAEELVRQLRLRDVGGIIVIDFIDMVLENNRDLVLRRLVECLARDRTKHQVAEVTSLGLVQMTRKRVGQGLLEAFSEVCECCNGRGIHVSLTPVDDKPEKAATTGRRKKRKGEVEKTVERKLARHEATKERVAEVAEAGAAGDGSAARGAKASKSARRGRTAAAREAAVTAEAEAVVSDDADEAPEVAVEDAAEIAAEVTESGPPLLDPAEPVDIDADDDADEGDDDAEDADADDIDDVDDDVDDDEDDDADDDVDDDEDDDYVVTATDDDDVADIADIEDADDDSDDAQDDDADDADDSGDADDTDRPRVGLAGTRYPYDLDESYEDDDFDGYEVGDEPVANGRRRRRSRRASPNPS
ncbi:MAG TPA: Rne/Rng family ribonuclease [Streptosporangiaceae bacterium]